MKNLSKSIRVLALAAAATQAQAASPVVVELFTSQGCSSCPDADKVFSSWGRSEFEKGTILPLSYNVDYWNYLGWRDIFSTPVYSRLQRRYAQTLGVGVYTPQMVVAGRSAFVGSDEAKARKEASRFRLQEPKARIEIKAADSARLKLTVAVTPLQKREGSLRVMLAVFENDLVTQILSGENAGSALRNDFVVRRLMDLGELPPEATKTFRRAIEDPWDPAWKKDHSGAAIFIQDSQTLAIHDAASLYPLERSAKR